MTAETDDETLRRLAEAKQEHGQLLRPVELFGKLLQLQVDVRSKVKVAVSPQGLTKEAIEERLKNRESILEFGGLALDWALVQELIKAAAQTVAEYTSSNSEGAGGVESITSSTFPLHQAVEAWYQGSSLAPTALAHSVSEGFLHSVILVALQPFLKAYSQELIGSVNQKQWRRRFCPVCGGQADFAFLDKESGARWLLCSRCDSQWLFQRLECPYCGNTEQKTLAYFTDGTELYRLYVCEECKSYIKAIDLRKTESDVLLPLERIVTSDLDRQAREKGYMSGVTPTIPFEEIGGSC